MNNNWVRLAILLSVLLLIAFPFVGLVPLTLLFVVAVSGLVFQVITMVMARQESASQEPTQPE